MSRGYMAPGWGLIGARPLAAVGREGGSRGPAVIALVQVRDDGGWMHEVAQRPRSHPSVKESIRIPLSDPTPSSLSPHL